MKLLASFLFLGLFALPNCSSLDCEYCRSGLTTLFDQLTSKDGVGSQIILLNSAVCSEFDDIQGCQQGVQAWWPRMNAIMFNYADIPYICKHWNNFCDLPKVWNCEMCKAQIQAFAGLWLDPNIINSFVRKFQDVALCNGMDLETEQVEFCQAMVEQFVPLAFKALFEGMQNDAARWCHFHFDGVC